MVSSQFHHRSPSAIAADPLLALALGRFRGKNIFFCFSLAFIFFKTQFYFFSEVNGGFIIGPYLKYLITLALGFGMFVFRPYRGIGNNSILVGSLLVVGFIYFGKCLNLGAYNAVLLYQPNYLDFLGALYIMCGLKQEDFRHLLRIWTRIFIIINLPSLLIYLMVVVNFSPPYQMVDLENRGYIYRSYYWISILTDYTIFSAGPFNLPRLCGLFFEPGLMGTLCMWLLGANVLLIKEDRFPKLMLLAMGMMSLSFAFFVVGLFIWAGWSFRQGKFRIQLTRMFGVGFFIFVCYLILPEGIRSGVDSHLLSRFIWDVETSSFAGDTRVGFGEIYRYHTSEATIIQKLFGHGVFSSSFYSVKLSSYHLLLFEFGYFGFALMLCFAGYIAFRRSSEPQFYWVAFIAFGAFLSFYQRPQIFAIFPVIFMATCWQLYKRPTVGELRGN